MSRFFVGITGASGHAYTARLVHALLAAGQDVDLSITGAGVKVLRHELGLEAGPDGADLARAVAGWVPDPVAGQAAGSATTTAMGTVGELRTFPSGAIEAPASSGTSLTGGVILCPCSMGTLARISVGFSSNLVERAADVALKERRPLVLVPRETPLSEIHLENMLRLARLGARVLPASPGFYHGPRGVEDLVDQVVGKVLDALGVEHAIGARWKGLARPDGDPGITPT